MRIINDKGFATRPTEELHEKPKYFLIYEGSSTEPKYFEGICKNKSKLAINEKISIVSVLRSIDDLNNSHPKYALELGNEIKKQSKNSFISKENFLKSIKDLILAKKIDDKEKLIRQAEDYVKDYANDEINYDEIDNLVIDIFKEAVFENISTDILEYLKNQRINLDYNEEIDVINLIVDRDKSSFKDYQYFNLLNECYKENIKLYVSNPCFEVWLLMHFDEFENLDHQKLLENKRVSKSKKSRKYADKMLSNIIGYNKKDLKFDTFIDRVDDAIKREKNYCENLKELENKIGSNVGKLIENLRKQ